MMRRQAYASSGIVGVRVTSAKRRVWMRFWHGSGRASVSLVIITPEWTPKFQVFDVLGSIRSQCRETWWRLKWSPTTGTGHCSANIRRDELRDSADGLLIPILGIMMPNMGINKRQSGNRAPVVSGVADALFTKVQQRVLAVLFGNYARSFYANELIALACSGSGAVQRELAQLEAAELVTVRRVGNQKHYQANASAPIFEELRGLVLKTSGLVDVLRAALAPLAGQIDQAFIYGSVAKGKDTANSDIDLMVISEKVTYADLFAALEPATTRLQRTVNPTSYSPTEIDKRIRDDNAFVKRVLAQSKLWVVGEGRKEFKLARKSL